MIEAGSNRRLDLCKLLVAERRLVGELIGFDICASPAWDVLLDLYVAQCEGRPIYLWSLCVAANIPLSSAHRRISDLISKGVLSRGEVAGDGRRVAVALTEKSTSSIDRLLDEFDRRAATYLGRGH